MSAREAFDPSTPVSDEAASLIQWVYERVDQAEEVERWRTEALALREAGDALIEAVEDGLHHPPQNASWLAARRAWRDLRR
jgi:hypothetical protein